VDRIREGDHRVTDPAGFARHVPSRPCDTLPRNIALSLASTNQTSGWHEPAADPTGPTLSPCRTPSGV
jgi:hypothetical protein